jgi:hypothetical protein
MTEPSPPSNVSAAERSKEGIKYRFAFILESLITLSNRSAAHSPRILISSWLSRELREPLWGLQVAYEAF